MQNQPSWRLCLVLEVPTKQNNLCPGTKRAKGGSHVLPYTQKKDMGRLWGESQSTTYMAEFLPITSTKRRPWTNCSIYDWNTQSSHVSVQRSARLSMPNANKSLQITLGLHWRFPWKHTHEGLVDKISRRATRTKLESEASSLSIDYHGPLCEMPIYAEPFSANIWRRFYTGFFKDQSHIFGPLVTYLGRRLIAYQVVELQKSIRDMVEDARRERYYQCHE